MDEDNSASEIGESDSDFQEGINKMVDFSDLD